MELIVHPMCPYAQRAILAKAFKNIDCPMIQVSLANKPPELLHVNPLGKVPAMKITQNNKEYHLFESLQVCEYLDSFPGPSLFPRLPSGQMNFLQKTIIDMHIKVYIDPVLMPAIRATRAEEFTAEILEDLNKVLTPINDQFLNHGFFMTGILGRDEVTMADVALLPFIQRCLLIPGVSEALEAHGRSIQNIRNWYGKMNEFDWVKAADPIDSRLINLGKILKSGEYKGLDLPLTIYDDQ